MSAGTLDMGKKTTAKVGGDDPDKLITVKLKVDLHRKVRTLAGYHGKELVDFIDSTLRPVIDRLYSQMGREIHEEGD